MVTPTMHFHAPAHHASICAEEMFHAARGHPRLQILYHVEWYRVMSCIVICFHLDLDLD